MKIGFTELLLVFIVALLVIGPDKLPLYAKKLGIALREFRNATNDMTKEIRESVVEPLEEAQKPLREAMAPLEELENDVKGNIKGLEKSFDGLSRGKSAKVADEKIAETSQCEAGAESEARQEKDPAETAAAAPEMVAEAGVPAESEARQEKDSAETAAAAPEMAAEAEVPAESDVAAETEVSATSEPIAQNELKD